MQPAIPKPLSGIVFPLQTLERYDDTSRGDLARQIQRIVALGFTSVLLPFSFNEIGKDDYLPNLVRECNATTEEDFRATLLPPDFDPIVLAGLPLPEPLGIVPDSSIIPVCNWYLSEIKGLERFLSIVRVFLQNGLVVVLQNTDGFGAIDNPTAWITNWVKLSTQLVDLRENLSGRLFLSPLNNTDIQQVQWDSQSNNAGLTDLYRTLLPAIDNVLPTVNYLLEGAGGYDFSQARPLLQQTQSSPRNGRIVPLADSLSSITNLTTQYEYMQNDGVCLTADLCTYYNLATVTTLPYAAEYQGFLLNGTWYAQLQDSAAPSWAEVANMTRIGLRPWYSPRSAYNPLPGEPLRAVVGAQAAPYTDFPCRADYAVYDVSDSFPATGVLSVNVTNLKDVTVTPPYEVQVASSSLQQALQVFGASQLAYSQGLVTATLDQYYDILWPAGKNMISLNFIVQLTDAALQNVTISVGGLLCDIQS